MMPRIIVNTLQKRNETERMLPVSNYFSRSICTKVRNAIGEICTGAHPHQASSLLGIQMMKQPPRIKTQSQQSIPALPSYANMISWEALHGAVFHNIVAQKVQMALQFPETSE
jgi:hypothetical protein